MSTFFTIDPNIPEGAWNPKYSLTAATNNATVVKASPGYLGGYTFSNTNAAARYVKFYNKASAPAPATDTPVLVVAVPAGTVTAPGVVTLHIPGGVLFSVGISFAVVTGIAVTDNTSVTAGDMVVNILWR